MTTSKIYGLYNFNLIDTEYKLFKDFSSCYGFDKIQSSPNVALYSKQKLFILILPTDVTKAAKMRK